MRSLRAPSLCSPGALHPAWRAQHLVPWCLPCRTNQSPPRTPTGDLKCGNVIINEAFAPQVADLGLSNTVDRLLGKTAAAQGGPGDLRLPAGTIRYLAPEVLNGLSGALVAPGGSVRAGARSSAALGGAGSRINLSADEATPMLAAVDTVRIATRVRML